MSEILRNNILNVLKNISFPSVKGNIVENNLIHSLVIRGKHVGFSIEANSKQDAENKESLRSICEERLMSLPEVDKVTISFSSSGSIDDKSDKAEQKSNTPSKLPPVVVAIGAGKGGVGKSTITMITAYAFKARGLNVAIADADIYGPSIPTMLGLQNANKPDLDSNGKMVPLESNGLKANSIGFLVDDDTATIWRGPMATKALYQLLFGTCWDGIDVLLIDLPPGTGDIQLSLAKQVPLTGSLLVSTPQNISVVDVKKACDMFKKLSIPILGVVENMSYIEDKSSNNKNYIFGSGNVTAFASESEINYIGELPLSPEIREALDKGVDLGSSEIMNSSVVENITSLIINK